MMKKLFALVAWLSLLAPLVIAAEEYTLEPPPKPLTGDTIIAQYGDEKVTLGDFWARIRFERWLYWRALEQLVIEQGDAVLDLSSVTNPYRETLHSLLNFLMDEGGFAQFVWQRLTREAFYRDAAAQREFVTSPCAFLEAWAQLILWPPLVNCSDTDEFANARTEFIANAAHFTGITENALRDSISAQLLLADLRVAIRAELPPVSELPTIRARQICTNDAASSAAALDALKAGGDFTTTMLTYGADTDSYGNSGDLGYLTRGLVVTELDRALFAAELDEWIGPIESDFGFHVARVIEIAPQIQLRHIQVPSLFEAEALRAELQAGVDFATLARLHSHDTPTASLGGEIGYFTRTQLLPEMEDVVFSAEIGELLGPLESAFGYHLVEIMDIRPRNLLAKARILVVETVQEAEALLKELAKGADFAVSVAEHSLDQTSKRSAGNLGYFRPDSERLSAKVVAAIFESEIDDILGPFVVENGHALLQVTDLRDEAFALRAQHILVGSVAAAEAALEQLRAGADFAALAREISIDPSAIGQDGDTLAFFTQGERSGNFLPGEIHPDIETAIADAEVGAIVGPIETEMGYFILRIEERSTRYLNPLEMEEALDVAVERWLRDQHIAQIRNQNDDWRVYIPGQPLPSDVSPSLSAIDAAMFKPE